MNYESEYQEHDSETNIHFQTNQSYTPNFVIDQSASFSQEILIPIEEKHKRFGRTEDRDLFDKLKRLCRNQNRDISDFWIHNGDVDYFLDEILDEIQPKINFKGTKLLLLKRIRKLALNQSFSYRERKLLAKLVKLQLKEGQIDLSKLEYFFPGKESEMIKNEVSLINISK